MRSAMHALTGARELARPGEEVLILSDSDRDLHHDWRMYGAWALRKNKALVERNRRALAALHGPMARRCGSSTSERMPAAE